MIQRLVCLFGIFFLFVSSCPAGPGGGTGLDEWGADHLLMGLRAESGAAADRSGEGLVEQLGLPVGVKVMPGGVRASAGAPLSSAPRPAPFYVVQLNGQLGIEEALHRLKGHPWVEYVERDGIGTGAGLEPTDPEYPRQWHHVRIESPHAWSLTRGDPGIIVAVLDTGLNTSLHEFEGRLVPGYDFVNDRSFVGDDHGHGTAVAGVIGANANNDHLVAGVDWNCRIMPVKVLDSANWGLYSWWANGIYFAVANGARVINLSAGGSTSNTTLGNAVRHAVASGAVFVTITHNHGTDTITFPGRMPETITVGATNREDRRASFSNWGPEIDLVAPGRDIYTVSRSGTLTSWWGTSFAAPQVAGVAALLLSLRPELENETVRLLLRAAAEDEVGDWQDTPGFDPYYGAGRLNAADTIALAMTRVESLTWEADTSLRLRWPVRPNARQKAPFAIEISDDLAAWAVPSPEGAIEFGDGFAEWVDEGGVGRPPPGAAERRFYRIRIRE